MAAHIANGKADDPNVLCLALNLFLYINTGQIKSRKPYLTLERRINFAVEGRGRINLSERSITDELPVLIDKNESGSSGPKAEIDLVRVSMIAHNIHLKNASTRRRTAIWESESSKRLERLKHSPRMNA